LEEKGSCFWVNMVYKGIVIAQGATSMGGGHAKVQSQMTSSEIRGGGGGKWHRSRIFSGFFSYSLLITTPALLHAHLSLPNEARNSPDQAAYYHTLRRGFISDLALGWFQSKGSLLTI
jgi:hypothetical protein